MKTLTVHASSTYDIHIGEGILPAALERVAGRGRFCVVTDSNVEPLYGETVRGLLAAHGRVSGFTFPAGETSKTLGTFSLLLEHLAGAGLTRSDTVVALGGGVTGDLAGFAAGCYLRGVRVIQIPTTLLAMIDSSVGGKTGVDLTAGKNLAGVFWQPAAVVADTALLSTLEPSVLADGMAEAVKYGMIADDALFASIERGEPVTADMIFACVDCKRRLVEADERDTGARQLLNFGHSFGHAIEKASGYAVGHGAAVAAGMVAACPRRSAFAARKRPRACAPCCAPAGCPTSRPIRRRRWSTRCCWTKSAAATASRSYSASGRGAACCVGCPSTSCAR